MKQLTWQDVLERLQALPAERLQDNVSVLDVSNGEYFPVTSTGIAEQDVLDAGAFVLHFNE